MRNFQNIIILCIMAILLLCIAPVVAGDDVDISASGIGVIMAIPEVHFLSVIEKANPVESVRPVRIGNEAIGSFVKAYKETGDEKYARRLAAVLYRFSLDFKSLTSGAPAGQKHQSAVVFEPVDGVEMALLQAYLTVRDTASVKKLSGEMGVDLATAIEDGLIRAMVDVAVKEHYDKMASDNSTDNPAEIFPRYLVDIALAGRAINEPEYVRVVCKYLSEIAYYRRSSDGDGLTFDMHSSEGQQRHLWFIERADVVFGAIEGYSDPAGYKDKQGRRYDDISLKDFPYIEKMMGVLAEYAFPDGQMNLLGDSVARKVCGPLKKSANVLLAGYGHAVLGAGVGSEQSQVQLHFSGQGGSERHGDGLGLVWYAHGRQMSGELGGQRDNGLRLWAESTLAHNTVVIDRLEQSGGDTFGNVSMYVSDIKGLSVIQVDGVKAYRHLGVKTYRRTIIHNTFDVERPYFVDVFEVEGGATHDYSVHGSVFGDMVGECSLSMGRMKGEQPMLEVGEKWGATGGIEGLGIASSKYGYFRNVDKARANRDFNVTFTYKDDKGSGTRIHMPVDPSMEVFLGETPAMRHGGSSVEGNVDGKIYDSKMPHFIARRTGKKGLRSTFVAVYDMFEGEAKIQSVRRLSSLNAYVSLEIDLGERVDKLLYCPGGKRSMIGGGVQMKGRLGLVTEVDGRSQGFLIDGTILRKSPMMVRMKKASYSGRILTAMRKDAGGGSNAFTVDALLPIGGELSGKWMIVTHPKAVLAVASSGAAKGQSDSRQVCHAYEIDRVERKGGKMVVYLKEDHGQEIDGDRSKEIFSGWSEFAGANRFVIYTNAKSLFR